MIKGFAITPIIEGRIGIGELVENGNGMRLPQKIDHIVITKMHQKNGTWGRHPEMDRLIQAQKEKNPNMDAAHADKLRSIPVRILFDRPDNNFRAEYTCFDKKARQICAGNGLTAKRRTGAGIQEVSCPGADICDFGDANRCMQLGRLLIGMESSFEKDPLVGFMFRTKSFNSIRALSFRLRAFAAVTGNRMAGMPCNLVMKAKSTAASFHTPIYYLDLEPRDGLVKAAKGAADYRIAFEEAGLKRDELEQAVTEGIAESAFFEGGDDGEEVIEEFGEPAAAAAESEKNNPAGTAASGAAKPCDARCAPDQVAEIERLLKETGKELANLLEWLVKPADTPLATLTPDEASQAIEVLTPKARTASPAAAAEGSENRETQEAAASPVVAAGPHPAASVTKVGGSALIDLPAAVAPAATDQAAGTSKKVRQRKTDTSAKPVATATAPAVATASLPPGRKDESDLPAAVGNLSAVAATVPLEAQNFF